jgi:hypothetical protein
MPMTMIANLTQKCTKLESKLDSITEQILEANNLKEKAIWNSKLQRIQTERQNYEKQIESLRARQRASQCQDLDHKNIGIAIENLVTNFESLDGQRKHLMISSIVDRIDLTRESIEISIKNPPRQTVVNQGMQLFYCKEEWLRRTDSNRRPGD